MTALAPAPEFSLARLLQDAPPVVPVRCVDLGAVTEPEHLRGTSDADLYHRILHCAETLKDTRFEMGDAAAALIVRYGATATEQARVFAYLASKTDADSDELYRSIRVARQFPLSDRAAFGDKSWTWFVYLTDQTAFLGKPGERHAEVLKLAHGLKDLRWGQFREAIAELKAECEASAPASLVSETGERLSLEAGSELPSLDAYRETPQDRYAGPQGLSPQTAGASTESDLAFPALQREIDRLNAKVTALSTPLPPAEAALLLFETPDGVMTLGACRQRFAELEGEGYRLVRTGGVL